MIEDLQFVPLKAPLSSKALETYRKDAAWTDPLPPKSTSDARGRIQWVSIAYKNKQIGIARLELAPPQFCYVSELIILSKFRGRGCGKWFMGKIEQYCLTFGIHRLLLQAGQGSESFYAAQSFVADPMVPSMLRKDLNPFQRKMFVPGR